MSIFERLLAGQQKQGKLTVDILLGKNNEVRKAVNGVVQLPDKSTYKLRVANGFDGRCEFKLFTDGEDFAGFFQLEPNKTMTIERPQTAARLFTFSVETSAEAKACGAKIGAKKNGLLKVVYVPERKKKEYSVMTVNSLSEMHRNFDHAESANLSAALRVDPNVLSQPLERDYERGISKGAGSRGISRSAMAESDDDGEECEIQQQVQDSSPSLGLPSGAAASSAFSESRSPRVPLSAIPPNARRGVTILGAHSSQTFNDADPIREEDYDERAGGVIELMLVAEPAFISVASAASADKADKLVQCGINMCSKRHYTIAEARDCNTNHYNHVCKTKFPCGISSCTDSHDTIADAYDCVRKHRNVGRGFTYGRE